MDPNINQILSKYNLENLANLNENSLKEVYAAMRQISQHWENVGRESVREYDPQKLKAYKSFTENMTALQYEFKFTKGTPEEIAFWHSLIDKKDQSYEYMTKRMMLSQLSDNNKEWTFTPNNMGILLALQEIDKLIFESSIKDYLGKFTADMYAELRQRGIMPPDYDKIYAKEMKNNFHKCSLKALNAFYNYFKSSPLFINYKNVKYHFLYAAFTTSPSFFDKTLKEMNENIPENEEKFTLKNIIQKAFSEKSSKKWSIKEFSLPVFEYGLKDSWFMYYFLPYTFKSPPHFQLILNTYGEDTEVKKNIEKQLKTHNATSAQIAYEKHILSKTITSHSFKKEDKPKFKI